MDSKIFLRKYRVAAEEIAAVGKPGERPRAYEGEEIDSGKTVIVEVVPAGSLEMPTREKLEAEAAAAKKLTHANIPALYDFGVEDDLLVYVTEDCEGTLAEEWVNANGPMPVGPVLRIASQVVSALGAAAFQRLAHRAINPGNLVLVPGQTAEGEWPLVKILHFVGIVPTFSETDAVAIAPDKALPYASPEQLKDGVVDFRSEIYSLGGTMWFLLTGTPPPMAAQMTTAWLAVDKMNAMPKKVGRLLPKMLSVDPAERPGDPLAFYRELQDCLTDVARRETTPRPAAVPAARTIAIELPEKRRSPLKVFARLVLCLALSAGAAFGLHTYLRHLRVVQAEEPIGVPIGVTDTSASASASASAPPVSSTEPDTMVSIVRQPTPVTVNANTTQSVPSTNAESDNIATPAPEPTAVTANNLSTLPATIDSSQVVSTSKAETAPAPSPIAETSPEEQPTPAKKTIMHEVRRAQPADEDEAPAEPSPPSEGPHETAPETSSVAKTEPSRVVEAEVAAMAPARQTERPAKPKRRTDEKIYLLPGHEFEAPPGRLPRGSVRGRFVGVTADGKWMFELPSREIAIVPPPAESSPPGEGPAVVTPAPTASPGPQPTPETPRKKSRKPKRPEPDPTILLKVPPPEN
jgi:serine/threonine-protein kinase